MDLPSLGARLQAVAREVGAAAHPFAGGASAHRGRTLIHGGEWQMHRQRGTND